MDDSETTVSSFKIAVFFGRIHVILIHFPVAWLFLTALVTLAKVKWPGEVGSWDLFLLVGTTLVFIPALASGWVHHLHISNPDDVGVLLSRHKFFAFTTFGFVLTALIARCQAEKKNKPSLCRVSMCLVLMAALFVGLTGHLGGSMVFGAEYLNPFAF